MKKVRVLGLDVHADTIAVAVVEPNREVRSLGMIPNREESVRKLVKKLGPPEQLQSCMKPARQATFSTGNWRVWEWSAKWWYPCLVPV